MSCKHPHLKGMNKWYHKACEKAYPYRRWPKRVPRGENTYNDYCAMYNMGGEL